MSRFIPTLRRLNLTPRLRARPQLLPARITIPTFTQIALPSRGYATAAGLSKEKITERVMSIMQDFEKVNQEKLTATSSFTSDLGLDSLDAVEVVMAIEEEFAIEIPDAEADEITTVGQAIDYIAKTPEAH